MIIFACLGVSVVLCLYVTIKYFANVGHCGACKTSFFWNIGSVFGKSTLMTRQPSDVTWQRNGDMALEYIRYPLMWLHTCNVCKHVTEYKCWFSQTPWEPTGEPFPVRNCPICAGAGKQTVTINSDVDLGWSSKSGIKVDYLQGRTGHANCMFCTGRGYVTLDKLKTLSVQ